MKTGCAGTPYDPENNLYDFIQLVHPNRNISKSMINSINSLGCCKAPTPVPMSTKTCGYKKDTDMRTYNEVSVSEKSDLAKTREYLESRICSEFYVKTEESSQFFTGEPDLTTKERIQRIKDGKFIWSKDADKADDDYRNWADYISFRDTPTDPEGYGAAVDKIIVAKQDALDVINTSPEADGLAALKAFKSATFH